MCRIPTPERGEIDFEKQRTKRTDNLAPASGVEREASGGGGKEGNKFKQLYIVAY